MFGALIRVCSLCSKLLLCMMGSRFCLEPDIETVEERNL